MLGYKEKDEAVSAVCQSLLHNSAALVAHTAIQEVLAGAASAMQALAQVRPYTLSLSTQQRRLQRGLYSSMPITM